MTRFFVAMILGLFLSMPAALVAADKPADKPASGKTTTYNHDMSAYKALAQAAIDLVKAGKIPDAHAKTKELEKTFDSGTKDFKKADKKSWKPIDVQMDVAIKACEGTDAAAATAELTKFIEMLDAVPKE